jgi:hypothetical protein
VVLPRVRTAVDAVRQLEIARFGFKKTPRTGLRMVTTEDSPNGPFNITQAGVCGLVYHIHKALDDGSVWYSGPSKDGKTIEHVQVMDYVHPGIVRLLLGTHDLQFTPDIMEVLWNQRGMYSLSTLSKNIAASITNIIRMTTDDSRFLTGQSGIQTTVFHVRWSWIIQLR